MRTARSAATASHPCVEHATEGIKKKNPAGNYPTGFSLPTFFLQKKAERFVFSFAYFSFFVKRKTQRGIIPLGFSLPTFFLQKKVGRFVFLLVTFLFS
ncbi:MAG: hypothetical protein E7057_07355 [Lentisphaerae bacterium]|nr:hypothetical protein [Lentisphaerota bacterium]